MEVVSVVGGAALTVLFETLLKSLPRFYHKDKEVKKEINEWGKILNCLKGYIPDAEDKQFSTDGVRVWLQDLEHLAYDAEDILQYFEYEVLSSQIENRKQAKLNVLEKMISKVTPQKSPKIDSKMTKNLKTITNQLQDLVNRKNLLKLLEVSGNDQSSTNRCPSREPSGSSPVDRLYGRDDEKRSLIDLLLQQEEGSPVIKVIPIVGMGGIGKTTLVQHVYNDENVQSVFDRKVWICVSKDYSRLKIMRGIMEALLSKDLFGFQDLSLIQEKIREALQNKKLLLVLDDFWKESREEWLTLCAPLLVAAPGSKIIVTTRVTTIADSIKTKMGDKCMHLSYLSEEYCWLLFCEHSGLDPSKKSRRMELGWEIVKKCAKLPLAVIVMGSILRLKPRDEQWESVLSSKYWTTDNDVMPVLRMSYNNLSSELKRCFSICAIIPEDYQFSEQELVHLWMGAGLISHLGTIENDFNIENRGRELFEDLVSRCLIMKEHKLFSGIHDTIALISGKKFPSGNDVYVMHDLVRELAQQISGTTCCSSEQISSTSVERCRYLSFPLSKLAATMKKLKILEMPVKLRNFVALGEDFDKICGIRKHLDLLIPNMRNLRVLSLRGYGDSELPESLSMLKLLRYLDLTGSLITKLPNSATTLYNLEYLNLSFCEHLNELPFDIGRLINLWCLDISESGIEKELPKGLEELKNLRELSDFIVGGSTGLSLEALGGMRYLKGGLNISSLENVSCVENARLAKLKEKKLEALSLEWDNETTEDSGAVLEGLQPGADLKSLSVWDYNGKVMSSWLESTKLRQLKELHLDGCVRCTTLPAMGSFPFLINVSVKRMSALKTIGVEWYGSSSDVFPNLEILAFEELEELEEWEYYDGIHFPKMKQLQISECPRLCHSRFQDLLESMPMMESLQVDQCDELVIFVPQLPELQTLMACDCKEVGCVEDFNLETLQRFFCCSTTMSFVLKEKIKNGIHLARGLAIYDRVSRSIFDDYHYILRADMIPYWVLPSNFMVGDEDGSTKEEMKVEAIVIKDSNMEDIPSWVFDAMSLREMVIKDCDSLNVLSDERQRFSLHVLDIRRCPNLKMAENMLSSTLETLWIRDVEAICPGIIHKFNHLTRLGVDGRMWDLIKGSDISLPNLCLFSIHNGKGIKAFPEDNMPVLFQNIKKLCLNDLCDLTYITSLKWFKFLESITLYKCPRLGMLTEEKLPSSIYFLWIDECDLIEEKVRVCDAEFIAKISHIPDILVGKNRIYLME